MVLILIRIIMLINIGCLRTAVPNLAQSFCFVPNFNMVCIQLMVKNNITTNS